MGGTNAKLIMDDVAQEYGRFQEALRGGNVALVSAILMDHPDWVNRADQRGFTPLILAAYFNHSDVVDALITLGANLNAADATGNTALMGAIFKGYEEVAEALVIEGADVNQQNKQGMTALTFAVNFNHRYLAQYLVDNGASLHLKDATGKTPLDHAIGQGLPWAREVLSTKA